MSEQLAHGETADADEAAQRARLGVKIARWNTVFAHLSVDGQFVDLRERAQADLDEDWPYGLEPCAFAGYGQAVTTGPDGPEEDEDFIDYAEGVSEGFFIVQFGRRGARHWGVAYGFDASEEEPSNIDKLGHTWYFLNANYADIVPVSAIDEVYAEGADFPAVHEILSEYADVMARSLDSKQFLKLTAAEQRFFIEQSVQDVTSACELGGGIDGKGVVAEGTYAFTLRATEHGFGYGRIDITDKLIKGRCQGVDVLAHRQLKWERPITHRGQLVDPASGFCLVLQLDRPVVAGIQLYRGQELFIPIAGQDLHVSFDPAVVNSL